MSRFILLGHSPTVLLRLLSVLCLFCFTSVYSFLNAQSDAVSDFWRSYLSELVFEGRLSEDDAEEMTSLLEDLEEEPINLLACSSEDLRQIPFLSDYQIRSFIHYRHKNPEGLLTVWDLKMIPSFDEEVLRLIYPFVTIDSDDSYAGVGRLSDLLRSRGKNHVGFTYSRPFKKDRSKEWRGSPDGYSVRYRYEVKNNFSAGVLGELDNYEKFEANKGGFDHISAHLEIQRIGRLKRLVLGDYKLSAGYGLVFGQGKFYIIDPDMAGRTGFGLRKSFSQSEFGFQRGAAMTLGLGRFDLTFGVSRTKIDARMESGKNRVVRSISFGGMHRTDKEYALKNRAQVENLACLLEYQNPCLILGGSAVRYSFRDAVLRRPPSVYKIDKLCDIHSFCNLSLYHRYSPSVGRLAIFGEEAFCKGGALAFLEGISYHAVTETSTTLTVRSFSNEYWSFYGKADSRFSGVTNEKGVKLSFSQNFGFVKVSPEIDWYKSISPRYNKSRPTKGTFYNVRIETSPYRKLSSISRINLRDEKQMQRRFSFAQTLFFKPENSKWLWRMEARGLRSLHYKKNREKVGRKGILFGVRNDYDSQKAVKTSLGLFLFNTDSGAERIYIPQRNVRWQYQSPFVYGKGWKCFAFVQLKCMESITLEAKVEYLKNNLKRYDSMGKIYLTTIVKL